MKTGDLMDVDRSLWQVRQEVQQIVTLPAELIGAENKGWGPEMID